MNSKEKPRITSARRERYVRWQHYRITQLSFSINLFLGFAVASLGYLTSILIGSEKDNEMLECVLLIWSWSTIAGCLATLNRLYDFKYTAKKILKKNRCNSLLAAHLGKVTWTLFHLQIILYLWGAYIFIFKYVLA